MFRPNICRRNLKANAIDVGAQHFMMPETQGSTERDGERRSSLYSGSTPIPVSYCKEIGLGCGGRARADEERE
jgi:hypothetical protein